MTLGRLFLLFVAVPLADLTLLVWAGERIGFWTTVLLVVITAAVGSWLARREGTAAWRRVQSKLSSGGLPGPELMDGLIILVAGVLLLTPGFLTDVVGILGLLPPSRALARKALSARFQRAVKEGRVRVASGGMGGPFGGMAGGPFGAPAPPPVEDAEVVEEQSRPLRSDAAPEADSRPL
jgi:UPF0716 protein FxsA